MTHTHHRLGDRDSLNGDYILMAQCARGLNEHGAANKLKQILYIFAKHDPVNLSNLIGEEESLCKARGASIEDITKRTTNRDSIHAVFTNQEVVKRVLKDISEADLGISVIVSGIFDNIFHIANEVGITQPRTVNISLGILGKTNRLSPEASLEILTQCGHGLVSKSLVNVLLEQVRTQKKSAEQAAAEMARQCVCGAFNPVRAAKLINQYVR